MKQFIFIIIFFYSQFCLAQPTLTPQQQTASHWFELALTAYQQKDYHKAKSLFETANQAGHMKAGRYLGLMWLNGEGEEKSPEKAVKAFEISATKGDITSQYWLGYCYENGIGVSQNYATALGWYLISAQRGDKISVPAMQALANMYQQGLGVQADSQQANYWQQKAEQAPSIQH